MQKAMNRLFTLILALTLVAGGTVTLPRHAHADQAPGETQPPPSPDTGEGDPDWPDGKTSAPRSGPSRGGLNPGYRSITVDRPGHGAKWLWGFRSALSVLYRTFLRF